MSSEDWVLPAPFAGTTFVAALTGLSIVRDDGQAISVDLLRSKQPLTRFGRFLPSLLSVLEGQGVGRVTPVAVEIAYEAAEVLEGLGSDALDEIVPWSPFALVIKSRGAIGQEAFRYEYAFFWGREPVALDRRAFLVRRSDKIFRLDTQTHALVEAMDAWNQGQPGRDVRDALLSFAKVKGLAGGVGAQLDNYLTGQNVLVAPRLGVDLIHEPDGTISLAPRVAGVPSAEFRRVFKGVGWADDSYSVTGTDGREYQVILDHAQREVLERVARAQHLSGSQKKTVLEHPEAVFDGVLEAVDIEPEQFDLDLEQFSDRVIGVGQLQGTAQRRPASTGILGTEAKEEAPPSTVPYPDSVVAPGKLQELLDVLQANKAAGKATLEIDGVETPITLELEEQLRARISTGETPLGERRERPRGGAGVVLLIHKDEDAADYFRPADTPRAVGRFAPRALVDPSRLKPHQVEGLAWLRENFRLGRSGCLLADDMGLGKTLQVLTFIAAVLEHDEASMKQGRRQDCVIAAGDDPERPPWNPVLAVMPLILLENETWRKDMERFFEGHGAVFSPNLILRGSQLQRLRVRGSGIETLTGRAHLDIAELRNYRLVMTNYETVVNYQFSLGQVPWSIVVTDEAQEYKTPSTKVSHAVKALKARFRVAATGTPVETTLDDVWNIFDFLEPVSVLQSLREFRGTFSAPVDAALAEGRAPDLSPLRARLEMGTPSARVLRREKSTSISLPPKHEKTLECHLSPRQRIRHLTVLERSRQGGAGNHPLRLLNELMQVYQHPAIFPRFEGGPADRLIAECPKLARVIEALREIKSLGEKALVFTRSIPMQQILQDAFRHSFCLEVGIVNGRTSRGSEPGSSRETRRQILDRFRAQDGFGLLVLSPEVAGLGLTITEANHVIHYGRWWNPAKEAQATDRVYRIGQEREVHVYYPVARDPEGMFKTFDELLDDLLRRRKAMASEFLAPRAGEEALGGALADEIFAGDAAPEGAARQAQVVVDALDADEFEALFAAVEARDGASVILTPKCGDEGIDVISIGEERIRLIQCKKYAPANSIEEDAVDDLTRGLDAYLARRIRGSRKPVELVLATTGTIPRRIRRALEERNVDIIDSSRVSTLARDISPADVDGWLARRATSMQEVQAMLGSIL